MMSPLAFQLEVIPASATAIGVCIPSITAWYFFPSLESRQTWSLDPIGVSILFVPVLIVLLIVFHQYDHQQRVNFLQQRYLEKRNEVLQARINSLDLISSGQIKIDDDVKDMLMNDYSNIVIAAPSIPKNRYSFNKLYVFLSRPA